MTYRPPPLTGSSLPPSCQFALENTAYKTVYKSQSIELYKTREGSGEGGGGGGGGKGDEEGEEEEEEEEGGRGSPWKLVAVQ